MATQNGTPRFELVSFDICPYVQRSVITLLHKKIDHKLTFIDLAEPPEWFGRLSPLGKVPILLVRQASESDTAKPVVLFESAVINEYLDEVTPPQLAYADPLKKAFERAWVEVGAELLRLMYPVMSSSDQAEIDESMNELWETLDQVEAVLPGGTTFRGQEFSLVDAAFAPAFTRLMLFPSIRSHKAWGRLPKTRRWADALLARPEVAKSVVPGLGSKMVSYMKRNEAIMAAELEKAL